MWDDVILFVVVLGLLLAGIQLERWRARWDRRRWRAKHGNAARYGNSFPQLTRDNHPVVDAAEQLRTVMGAEFQKRRLLSKAEARVLYAAEKAVSEAKIGWRVMAQVSLGEVLSSPNSHAYSAINSKRVDLLIVARNGLPVAAIEYQGSGHYQGTAALRDAVKKEALRKAGVRYIEVTPDHDSEDVVREILRIAKQETAGAGAE